MPLPDSANIQRYIDALIRRTREGDFAWTRFNPSTYMWTSGGNPAARLNLQRIPDPAPHFKANTLTLEKRYFYVLQAYEISEGNIVGEKLKIDGESDDAVNEKLGLLFSLIESGISQRGLDFLAKIIGA